MTKIPLKRTFLGGARYQLSMILKHGRSPLSFDVLFDTGSPFELTLSQQDAYRMQISPKNLPKGGIISLAGLKYQSYLLKNKRLVMRDVNGNPVEFTIPEIPILISTKKGQKEKNEANAMPSIIGLKFLENHNLSLHINGKTKTGYLEKE